MLSDEIINEHLKAALEHIDSAISEIFKVPHEEASELYNIGLIGRAAGLISEFQRPIFNRNPQLKPPLPDDYVPDGKMSENEEAFVSMLSSEKLKEIDEALLSYAGKYFSKVAMLVSQMRSNKNIHIDGVPAVFYSQRIKYLVENGFLESQGNLDIMRYSEVRLKK